MTVIIITRIKNLAASESKESQRIQNQTSPDYSSVQKGPRVRARGARAREAHALHFGGEVRVLPLEDRKWVAVHAAELISPPECGCHHRHLLAVLCQFE